MPRFPSKQNALAHLNEIGVKFGAILDVGTHAETPELKAAFPGNRHILFEPASEFFPKIAANYSGLDWELVPIAVSDTDGTGRLRKIAVSGGEISHAKLDFNTTDAEARAAGDLGVFDVKTIRLDTFLNSRDEPKPYLLKIDVDGFEMPILRGAEQIWNDIDCIIIEATADTFSDRLQYIASRGFHIFDMVDQCYYAGVFAQADLVFVSDRLRRSNPRLRPWETEQFAWEKWVPVTNQSRDVPESKNTQVPVQSSRSDFQHRPGQEDDRSRLFQAVTRSASITDLIAKANEESLFSKVSAIDCCKANPFQPSLIWHPTVFGSLMQLDLRETVAQQIYLTGAFEPDILWFLSCVAEAGMVAIDGGAHIGFFTLALAKLIGATGKVHAFEPVAATKQHLDTNVRNAGLTNVFTHNIALWKEPATLDILDWGHALSAYNGVAAPRLPSGTILPQKTVISIEATSLDAFVARAGIEPDLIKLDVESAEFQVLLGMREILSKAKPIIVMEIGDFLDSNAASSFCLMELLRSSGYNIHKIENCRLAPIVPENRRYNYGNIVALSPAKEADILAKTAPVKF